MANNKEINHLEEQQERCKFLNQRIDQIKARMTANKELQESFKEQHQIMFELRAAWQTYHRDLNEALLELYELVEKNQSEVITNGKA